MKDIQLFWAYQRACDGCADVLWSHRVSLNVLGGPLSYVHDAVERRHDLILDFYLDSACQKVIMTDQGTF